MEDVQLRIHSGRTLLDRSSSWVSGPVRNSAEMAESAQPGNQGNLGSGVEKASTDRSVGSVPFDYSQLSDGGRAPDPGSHAPQTNLTFLPPVAGDVPITPPLQIDFSNQIEQTKEQMQTAVNPPVSLIKHNQVKTLALELMAERFTFNGEPKFTRVSESFCESLERFVYAALKSAIQKHPSTGKTIQDF